MVLGSTVFCVTDFVSPFEGQEAPQLTRVEVSSLLNVTLVVFWEYALVYFRIKSVFSICINHDGIVP